MTFDNQSIGLMIFYGVGFLMIIALGITYLTSKNNFKSINQLNNRTELRLN